MPSPPRNPRQALATVAAVLALAACQQGPTPHPVPSVQQIGSDLKCASGDHAFEDIQAGWGFCYPGSWRYVERSQGLQSPPGLDLTFEITDIPCAAVPSGSQERPVCSPDAGRFGFMIISTYERGSAINMAAYGEIDDVIDPADSRRWIRMLLKDQPPPRTAKRRPHIDAW